MHRPGQAPGSEENDFLKDPMNLDGISWGVTAPKSYEAAFVQINRGVLGKPVLQVGSVRDR